MKTTIYVPDPLMERMNKLKHKGVVINISGVCQQALEMRVEREEQSARGVAIASVLQRLEVTKSPAEQAFAQGAAMGRRWAREIASESELRTVAQLRPDRITGRPVGGTGHAFDIRYTPTGKPQLRIDYMADQHGQHRWVDLPETVPADLLTAVAQDNGVDQLRGFVRGTQEIFNRIVEARELLSRVEELQRLRTSWPGRGVEATETGQSWEDVHGEEWRALLKLASEWGLDDEVAARVDSLDRIADVLEGASHT